MWVSKEGSVRKKEILTVALKLFSLKGFNKTSINDIIKEVGVTKGTFYYYFKSKDDLMENILQFFIDERVSVLKKIADDERLNAIDKLNKLAVFMQGQNIVKSAENHIKIHQAISHNDLIIEKKILDKVMKNVGIYYRKIVKQGIKEGYFNTEFPDEIGEFVLFFRLNLDNFINQLLVEKDKVEENTELLKRKTRFFQDSLERILGLDKGTLKIVDYMENNLDKLLEKVNKNDKN